MWRRRRHGEGGGRERGAALVESVFVFPFLALVIFGVVEIGFFIRSAAVASSASRAGARLASATYTDDPTLAQAQTVVDTVEEALRDRANTDTPIDLRIYRAQANGSPADTNAVCDNDCFTFVWNDGTEQFVYSVGSWSDPDACGTTLDYVGVAIRLRHASFSRIFPWTATANERTVMRLEPEDDC